MDIRTPQLGIFTIGSINGSEMVDVVISVRVILLKLLKEILRLSINLIRRNHEKHHRINQQSYHRQA